MNDLLNSIHGKKTYGVVAIALMYLAGVKAGWWPFDPTILTAFGFGGLATMRHAVGQKQDVMTEVLAALGAFSDATRDELSGGSLPEETKAPGGTPSGTGETPVLPSGKEGGFIVADLFPGLLIFAALVGLICLLVGCAAIDPNADPLIVNVERFETSAEASLKLFLHEEKANTAVVEQYAPAVHTWAEWLRQEQTVGTNTLPRSSAMLLSLDDVKLSYKRSRTAANSNLLVSAQIAMQTVTEQANAWLPVITNKTVFPK